MNEKRRFSRSRRNPLSDGTNTTPSFSVLVKSTKLKPSSLSFNKSSTKFTSTTKVAANLDVASNPSSFAPAFVSTPLTKSSSIRGTNSGNRHQGLRAQAMSATTNGKSISSMGNSRNEPDHLLVLVHGILASTADWTYAEAELKRRLGKNFLIFVSSSNTYAKTFTGIDGAGKRLADEVLQIVRKTESLKRISFLANTLGGLFARYAIVVLYSHDTYNRDQPDDLAHNTDENSQSTSFSKGGMIAGLEPINFITLATPHLGVRGNGRDCWSRGFCASFSSLWPKTFFKLKKMIKRRKWLFLLEAYLGIVGI